jgi:hypothetical protein
MHLERRKMDDCAIVIIIATTKKAKTKTIQFMRDETESD